MNPNKYGIIEDKIKLPKILAVCHRGTQTKEDSPKDSTHSNKSKEVCDDGGSSDEGSVKVLEFSQIVQDTEHPENITIIKDTFSEEIRDHSSTSQATGNRYTYCREVIKPFLKDYSECNPLSDDEVINEVLKSVQKDFPDYQPCFGSTRNSSDIDSCSSDSKLEKPKRGLRRRKDPNEDPAFLCCEKLSSGAQPANASSDGLAFIPVKACEPEVKVKSKKEEIAEDSFTSCSGKSGDISEDICNMDKKSTSKQPALEEYDEPYDPCRKPKCARKAVCPEGIKPCKKPRNEPKVAPPPFCPVESGPKCTRKLTTGCEDENELKEQAKRAKQACREGGSVELPPVTTPPPQKSVMEAHCEALQTLKAVASSAMCKVSQVTKDTVSLIRTESAKQLEKIKAFGSDCEDMCDDSKRKASKKKSRDSGITEVTNILGTKNIMENLEQLNAEDVLHRMVEKMESTISMISEHIDFDTITNILKVEEKNSYERPRTPPRDFMNTLSRAELFAAEEPQEVKQDISSTANNMFTAIKSKIFSIFSDINKGTEENPESPDEDNEEN